jgi:hypothetical protein
VIRKNLLQVASQFSISSHLRINLEEGTMIMIIGARHGLSMKTKVTGVSLSLKLTGELKTANTRIAFQNPKVIN